MTADGCSVPLTRGLVAVIDFDDADLVLRHAWHAAPRSGRMYAASRIGASIVYLHRFLLQCPSGVVVDHIDGDGLNNRRANIRACTPSQNAANRHAPSWGTSRYRGVYWAYGKWRAQITRNKKIVYLGGFDTEDAAAIACNEAKRREFGEFASLNVVG